MKTILVVYTNGVKMSEEEAYRAKKYSFNTEADVKVGDVIESPQYDSPMQVTQVLDKAFVYVNSATGDLSDDFASTRQFKIRELIIGKPETEMTVYGKLK